jgi:hypothetical protein
MRVTSTVSGCNATLYSYKMQINVVQVKNTNLTEHSLPWTGPNSALLISKEPVNDFYSYWIKISFNIILPWKIESSDWPASSIFSK